MGKRFGAIIGAVVAIAILVLVRMNQEHKTSEETTRQSVANEKRNSQGNSAAGILSRGSNSGQEFTYTEELLSDAVKALLGLDAKEHNYNSLKDAISELSNSLSADDVAALRTLLHWPNDQFPEQMRGIEVNAVKNDVLDRLLRQNTLPENMGEQMVEMASSSDNDPVWRDYCIQFMSPFYERVSAENREAGSSESEQSVAERASVREAMFSALDEREGTLAGTSLIGLELLSRTHENFDRTAIIEAASEIAADESASAESRLTALRLSSLTGADESTAQTARNLAQTGETVQLRSAAIVTLGEAGSDEDRELLESFATSDNRQIVMAAEMALKKMDARN
jgi:hypothetical protein